MTLGGCAKGMEEKWRVINCIYTDRTATQFAKLVVAL
jgi:hypothetical protein